MIRNRPNPVSFAARAAAFLCAVLPSLAVADITSISAQGAGNGSERCLVGSFCAGGGTYGGALSLIAILEKDLGLGAFQRIDDGIDKVWQNLAGGQVLAVGRYAGDSSRLGIDTQGGFQALTGTVASGKIQVAHDASFFNDSRPGDFVKVANPAWTTIPVVAGASFALVLDDLSAGYRISSDPSRAGYANSGRTGLDYMVTYLVPDSKPHYVVAWEDRDPRNGTTGDGDYNDFIAELVFSQPAAFSVSAVPEPGPFALLAAGLVAIAWTRRKRPAPPIALA